MLMSVVPKRKRSGVWPSGSPGVSSAYTKYRPKYMTSVCHRAAGIQREMSVFEVLKCVEMKGFYIYIFKCDMEMLHVKVESPPDSYTKHTDVEQ